MDNVRALSIFILFILQVWRYRFFIKKICLQLMQQLYWMKTHQNI